MPDDGYKVEVVDGGLGDSAGVGLAAVPFRVDGTLEEIKAKIEAFQAELSEVADRHGVRLLSIESYTAGVALADALEMHQAYRRRAAGQN